MSNESESEPKLKIAIVDNGKWSAKTLEYEITNKNPYAEVGTKLQCDFNATLKEILDLLPKPKPEELERDDRGHILNKTKVWLPFTYEEVTGRNLMEAYYILRDQYPHLDIYFPYQAMIRPVLHSYAKNYKIVGEKAVLNENGDSVEPKEGKQDESISKTTKKVK